ncbi:MAG: ATP-dependent helicase, partial [Alphaproteobacteria bacterium]|nr:ATP-dependent helicase [Alphaproteobacteria bacterium]
KFRVAEIVRKYSPLISKASLRHKGDKQIEAIQAANKAVENLWDIFESGAQPRMVDVLRNIAASKLFEIPDSLITISQRSSNEQKAAEEDLYGKIANEEELEAIDSWDEALLATFEQVALYDDYINGRASFDTHQGVKGLEFPRVMVIVDDEEARGFMFSYAKLFGEKEKSPSDLKNEKEGNETSIDRTRRLFYVTCSRAEKSLAIVAYSNNPEVVKANLIGQGWFKEEETVLLSN